MEENRFRFDEIEKPLERLIREHGGRPTKSGPKPEQPLRHLRSSAFWVLHTQRANVERNSFRSYNVERGSDVELTGDAKQERIEIRSTLEASTRC